MKKLFFLSILVSSLIVNAQVPAGFNYQAVVRNSSGDIIANQTVKFKFSILQSSATGIPVYIETQSAITNDFGLANLTIGKGDVILGILEPSGWGLNEHFMKVEIDPTGGNSFIDMGTMQMLAVPYAFHAQTVEEDNVEDADSDPENELQELQLSGTVLGLTGSSKTVELPSSADGGDNWGTQTVVTDETLTGLGIDSNPLQIKNDGVTSAKILDGSILTDDIADFQITADKLANNSVTTEKILEKAITGIKIAQQGATEGQALLWNGSSWSPGDISYGTSNWLLNGNNLFYNDGNVGIGTSEPQSLLQIHSNTTYSTGITPILKISDNFKTWNIGMGNDGDRFSIASEDLTERLSILKSNGWVGIGTINPGSLLQIHSNTTYSSGITPIIKMSDNFKTWNIGMGSDGDRFSIASEDLTERFTIMRANGRTGIGTINPGSPLHVHSSATYNNGITPIIKISDNYKTWNIGLGFSDDRFSIASEDLAERFTILKSNGYVGIGTITPAYPLDIAGKLNLNKGIESGIALSCNGAEALWFNGTYYSWGYGADYNYFANPVSIKSTNNPGYDLVVNGTAAKTGGGSWSNLSDARLKNILGDYTKGLKEIIALQPIWFTYKKGNPRQLSSEEEQIGFIAQEVQKIFPEAVSQCADGYLDFNMHAVNVALVNAVKELKVENDRLKAENKQIINRLEKLENIVEITAQKTK